MIKLNNVNKFYNKGKSNQIHVVNNVSLELPDKGIVGIFGRSGCGKSTLFNLIGGLDKFEKGSILIDDQNIKKDTDLIRNKYIGYIFQNYYLHNNESCFNNVANSLRLCGIEDEEIIEDLVVQALKNVGMEKYRKRTPDTLSGGQQQRIAIARAIVKNPHIILADEPTGNLDDNNTIMIMELLKEISKNHLVLLITHEEKLVDYYCDMIINLNDGKVVNIIDNETKSDLISKDKNDIYLGDLDKKNIVSENTVIEYYGENIEKPLNIKIVNVDNKIYIQFDNHDVKVVDKKSEIKLKEGKFIPKKETTKNEIIIKDIPNTNKQFGKLFTFKDSVINGFKNLLMKKKRRIEKTMYFVLTLFSIVTVVFSSIFGTAFKKIEQINNNYNHNVFYIKATDEIGEIVNDAVKNKQHGMEYSHIVYNRGPYSNNVEFKMASFETVKPYRGYHFFDAVYLSDTLIEKNQVIVGRIENLEDNEIVITSQLADKIIEGSNYGNIKEYEDLIGWFCPTIITNDKTSIVAGIVRSNNSAIYLDENVLSDLIVPSSNLPIRKANKYGVNLNQGELVYLNVNGLDSSLITIGKDFKINGVDFKITEVKTRYSKYQEYLEAYYSSLISEEEYMLSKVKELYPSINESEYQNYYEVVKNQYYFDYLDIYYQYYDEYLEHLTFFDNSNFHIWLYQEKDIELAKYYTMSSGIIYYACKEYKEKNGVYPTIKESDSLNTKPYYIQIDELDAMYKADFYTNGYSQLLQDVYLLNDYDYYLMSKQTGYTSEIIESQRHEYYPRYILVYSNDVESTQSFLESLFEGTVIMDEGYPSVLYPSSNKETLLKEVENEIMTNLISIGVLMSIMSICMYFIMKSSTMNRIKEIGIYRAIGVTKKNFIFKFMIETLVLISTTVLIGYLLSSGFIWMITSSSAALLEFIYYPWYVALILLGILYLVTLVCGLLPILSLLKKTPSEILAKYDI